MLQNTIIGYPRIGSQRELKFLTEKYFRKEVSEAELRKEAEELRLSQWRMFKGKHIDWVPCGDFSFYDGMLDTACLLGAIPAAYKALGLKALDTYFAMARGYQREQGDVKALPMRKWFNTNYHYIVPVLEDSMELRLSGDDLFTMCGQALSIGIQAKPVLIGPFTFLKLARYQGKKARFAGKLAALYIEILAKLRALGVQWVQVEEPALVTDLCLEDIELFRELYSAILPSKGSLRVLLQTYFGDIRDIYRDVAAMQFDGLGLDFVEGKQTLSLIRNNGFPKDKTLFAGVVNGRNIWRNDYEKTLALLETLASYVEKDRIVLSTSCSLLHVPYTLGNEAAMDKKYKCHFAFAQEKLDELQVLQELFASANYTQNKLYRENVALIRAREQFADKEVQDAVAALQGKQFVRKPAVEQRRKLQQAALDLPILPTTTIGSFPQTKEVKRIRKAFKRGKLTAEEYTQHIREKIAACIALQEEIGLDVLVHGEFERNDMVEYFGENLQGFLFTQKAWVQSYGTRCVKPPIIWGDVKRTNPITVGYITYAQSLTKKPMKGMLTGPVTILNWSFSREDIEPREMAFQIALAIRDEVLALEAAGIRIIQIDEAAFKEKLPLRHTDWHKEYLDWAIAAFRLVHQSVKPATQIHTHMCYSEFEKIIKEIDAMDADVITFEAARSNLSIVDTLQRMHFRTEVGPGVYDIHSPRVPSVQEIEQSIYNILKKIPKEKLWINPDCGLKTRGRKEAVASLKNLVAAAKEVRQQLKETSVS